MFVKREEFMRERGGFRDASAELERVKGWATKLVENLNKRTVHEADEKAELRR